MSDAARPPIVVYRDHLLPASETFVLDHARSLRGFAPQLVGSRRVPGLMLEDGEALVVNCGGTLGRLLEGLHKTFGIAPGLMRRLRRLRPVLIHAHFGPDAAIALPLARRLAIPLIVTFHGYDVTMDESMSEPAWGHRLYFRRRPRLAREGTLFLPVASHLRARLIDQGFDAAKIVVFPNAVDTRRFAPDETIAEQPIVLFVGRLVEKKGCVDLVETMAAVQAEHPELELVVIGEGPLRGDLERQAESSLGRFRFLGLQPPDAVRSWMARAAMLAAPSVTASTGNTEGMPIVVLEAQSMALPVVGTLHAGIPEVVVEGETGLLVAEGDRPALAAAIGRLWRDAGLRAELGRRARQRACAHFDRADYTERLEAIYRQVLEQRDGPAG